VLPARTAVRIYALENVVEALMYLRKLTFAFDEYAEQYRDRGITHEPIRSDVWAYLTAAGEAA